MAVPSPHIQSPHIVTDVSNLVEQAHKLFPIVTNRLEAVSTLCTWLLVDVLALMCMTILAMGTTEATKALLASKQTTDDASKEDAHQKAIAETGHSVSSGLYFLGFLIVLVSSFYFGSLALKDQKSYDGLMRDFYARKMPRSPSPH